MEWGWVGAVSWSGGEVSKVRGGEIYLYEQGHLGN
jgi:hypothetical protein